MPLYEYRCRVCERLFQRLRAIADADASVTCPEGHNDVVRALSVVAPLRRGAAAAAPAAGGGGCCGGACGCGN